MSHFVPLWLEPRVERVGGACGTDCWRAGGGRWWQPKRRRCSSSCPRRPPRTALAAYPGHMIPLDGHGAVRGLASQRRAALPRLL